MNDQISNQEPAAEIDPEVIKHKIVNKELLTIVSIFVVMSVIVGVLVYFEKSSGLVTKLSEILANKVL